MQLAGLKRQLGAIRNRMEIFFFSILFLTIIIILIIIIIIIIEIEMPCSFSGLVVYIRQKQRGERS